MFFLPFFGAWGPNNLIRMLWYNHVPKWTMKHAQVVMHVPSLTVWRIMSSLFLP
jgi:hypothetical protein